jgi:hypothetical protein
MSTHPEVLLTLKRGRFPVNHTNNTNFSRGHQRNRVVINALIYAEVSAGGKRPRLPGFCTGAHVALAGYQLLTRDASRYRPASPSSASSRRTEPRPEVWSSRG